MMPRCAARHVRGIGQIGLLPSQLLRHTRWSVLDAQAATASIMPLCIQVTL